MFYPWEGMRRGVLREKLPNFAWGYDYEGTTRTVDVVIAGLRRKLDDRDESVIRSQRGLGHCLEKSALR